MNEMSKNFPAYIILGLSLVIIVAVLSNNHSTPQVNKSAVTTVTAPNVSADPIQQKFKLLSTQGNSSCSQQFTDSITTMNDSQHIQGSCCSQMVFSRYQEQIS